MATRKPANTTPETVETAELVSAEGYTDTDLKGIETFEDALRLAAETYGVEAAADLIGDGFGLIKGDPAKRSLIGRPIAVMEWKFVPGDFGGEFVVARIVAPGDNGQALKYILTDGSTGICTQLKELTERYGKKGGMVVHSGLRESQYQFCTECGGAVSNDHLSVETTHHVAPKSTFYLDPTRKMLTS